jgi:hypothetical protein
MTSDALLLESTARGAEDDSLAAKAVSLVDGAYLARGAVSLKLLADLGQVVSAHEYDCLNPFNELENQAAPLAATYGNGLVESTASFVGFTSGSRPDNLSIVRPYDGVRPGQLGVLLSTSVSGGVPEDGLTYHKSEIHVLDLPFDLTQISSLCVEISGAIEAHIAQAARNGCLISGNNLDSLVGFANESIGLAKSRGYHVSIVIGSVEHLCEDQVRIELAESGIVGPYGTMNLRVATNCTLDSTIDRTD